VASPEKFLETIRQTDGLKVSSVKTTQGSREYGDDAVHGEHVVTTHVIETTRPFTLAGNAQTAEGVILGGLGPDASAGTVKNLTRSIRLATGLELD
jgi:hypothetical protein